MTARNSHSIPGIYAVTHRASGTVYIGQAVNIRRRWEVHRSMLTSGKHRNRYLQRAWTKYGAEAFDFAVLVNLTGTPKAEMQARLNAAEIAALSRYPDAYNLMPAGGVIATSPETRAILSRERKARWADPAYRARVVAAIRERAADPEHQKRRGAGIAAYRNTPEAKAAVSAHMQKLWTDPEHRAAMSKKRRRNWQDPAYRETQTKSRSAAWVRRKAKPS
ncbi:MAG TPA: GIY-YIG nuclease family protein [Stellaceae bacterium]|jgi:group I intron endonuclease